MSTDAVTKVHPATREMFPDDPLEMQGSVVPGNVNLMLRLLVEEYARLGWNLEGIMQLACNPNYTSFHCLLQAMGAERLRREVAAILARCGVLRVREQVAPPPPEVVALSLHYQVGPSRPSAP